MENIFIEEDWEANYREDLVYLQERELETYIWLQHQLNEEEGIIIAEGLEETELEELKMPF